MKIKLNYNSNEKLGLPKVTKTVDFTDNMGYLSDIGKLPLQGLKLFERLNQYGLENFQRADLRSFEVIG